jgi:hypothetical protein
VTELTIALPLAGITGWIARIVWTRVGEARADAHLRRLLAPRVTTFKTDYARLGSGR